MEEFLCGILWFDDKNLPVPDIPVLLYLAFFFLKSKNEKRKMHGKKKNTILKMENYNNRKKKF